MITLSPEVESLSVSGYVEFRFVGVVDKHMLVISGYACNFCCSPGKSWYKVYWYPNRSKPGDPMINLYKVDSNQVMLEDYPINIFGTGDDVVRVEFAAATNKGYVNSSLTLYGVILYDN